MSDPDPLGKPYAAPPSTPASCNFGSAVAGDVPFTCNNKLIGAYQFLATYKALNGLLPTEFNSARDDNGHGTHTATTSAGNRGVAASIFGVPFGTVSGVAPRAHVIAYRVCANLGCYQSDSVAAVNQAIADGVDVINFSISGGNNPYADAVELAFASAYDNGVFVATSAGNSGPTAETVSHRGPWVTTVAASTSNRHFLTTLMIEADNGDTLELVGATVTDGIDTATPIVFPPPGQELCNTNFAPGSFTGKILVCRRGDNARIDKSYKAMNGGAVGMILYNPALQGLNTDNHYVPSVHIDEPDSTTFLNFMSSHTGETATWTEGTATAVPGDVMASFSSRGGPAQPLGISKPDITAPGVQILAGHTPMPATSLGGPAGELFQAIQGTSMSSPHIAGSAALLVDMQPGWTPGQIKSALMTTAVTNVVKEDGTTPATPFDTGSGRVDLTRAGWAELTFDETAANYMAHQNDLWNTNYPSLYHPNLAGSVTVQRTIHNETNGKSTWKLSVKADPGLIVTVPKHVPVNAGAYATFDITVSAPNVPLGAVRHATITFKHGNRLHTFPITIVRGEATVGVEKTCSPANVILRQYTDCTIVITNNSFDEANFYVKDVLPKRLNLQPNSIVGATIIPKDKNAIQASGTLAGIDPPDVAIAPGASPAGGYLPLSAFGIPAIAGMGDDTIMNYNVPGFLYAGEVWTSIGISSNGYLVIGGGSTPDNSVNNQNFPDANRPNNVLAAMWTDLNPAAAGTVRIGTLTDQVDTWIVVDWAGVRNFSSAAQLHSMEIWIGVNNDANPGEDISYAYGTSAPGDGGFATVGAENKFGNRGAVTYFNGTGTLPANGTQLRVTTTPATSGDTHTITFTARAMSVGSYTNCAEMTSNLFQGTAVSCFNGQVLPKP
ncbi:MAG: S8 family serine peptidase [Candidatus Promineofilum sp.]|nr:S8 family serine peptidase [Promineifilum sp.]